jgi:hypothetical protein
MQQVSPFNSLDEPNESNVKGWMDSLWEKYSNIEIARMNQGNIDSLFYAGEQGFINSYYNFYPQTNFQKFYFNLIQQPINMVTGYQRQHRKSIVYMPIEGSKQEFADDLTKLISYSSGYKRLLEKFSIGCEQATVSGMILLQPWLDFQDDPVNGTLDLNVWSYNSFIIDPFFRDTTAMSDCNFAWCQQYISKKEAINKFPEHKNMIEGMSGYRGRENRFYFLPENYQLVRNDLLILSYVWYKSSRKKKFLYNHEDGITYEYDDKDEFLEELVRSVEFFEIIEIQVPTYKLVVTINEQMVYHGFNPLGFDDFPLVPVFWNYDPHISQYDLRVRSLTRSMRDTQFLMNRRIILNHDISESSINTGYLRKENAVVNEEDLKYSGQGKDIIIRTGYEIADIQKIVPNAVPPSDMELANQLADFIFKTSGVNQELMGMATDSETGIQEVLKQGAGLVTLQKYFDQFDIALTRCGFLFSKIVRRWSPSKIAKILGKKPDISFFTKTFSKYDVAVAEGLNTAVQMQNEFNQIIQLNQLIGGIIPPRFILQKATIQGKNEIIAAVDEQQKMQSEMAQQEAILKQTVLEAQLQELQSKSVSNIAMAKEREARSESNVGLFEERLSEISQNRSLALKHKVDAIEKLSNLFASIGPMPVEKADNKTNELEAESKLIEDIEKMEARESIEESDEEINMMQNINPSPNMEISPQEGLL